MDYVIGWWRRLNWQEGSGVLLSSPHRLSFLADRPVTAVAAFCASQGERETAFSRTQAQSIVARLCRDALDGCRTTLVEVYELAVGHRSSNLDQIPTHLLVDRVVNAVNEGRLLLVPGWFWTSGYAAAAARRDDASTLEDRIARRSMTPSRPVTVPPTVEPPPKPGPSHEKTYSFVWDAPYTGDIKQYVNLKQAWDKRFGKEVELEGHVEPRDSGVVVAMTIVPDPNNNTHAAAATLGDASVTSAAEGKVKVKLILPVYGGTKFKVGGKTPSMASPAQSGSIEVWRRAFYQVTEMADAPDGTKFTAPADMISALKSAFDPIFFELEAGTKSTDTTPYKAHLTAAERSSLESSLKGSARDNRSPFKMNIVLVNAADIVAEQEWTANSVTTASVETPLFAKWPYEDTVISAQYQMVPAAPAAPGAWQNLPTTVEDVSAASSKVKAAIPGFAAGQKANVKIKYRYLRGKAGGWGGTTGTLFMCIGSARRANAAKPTGAELQQALTHEIGHALGLVAGTASWIDPDPRDAPYSLKHCGHKDGSGQPSCVMWFMLGGSGARLRFCSSDDPNDCAHFLLQSDYSGLGWI